MSIIAVILFNGPRSSAIFTLLLNVRGVRGVQKSIFSNFSNVKLSKQRFCSRGNIIYVIL